MEVLLEKFREKKPVIVQALKDAIDAVYCSVCINFDAATAVSNLVCLFIFNDSVGYVLMAC